MDLVFHPSLTALIVLLTLTPLLSCQSTLDTSPGLPLMTLPACLLKQVVTGTGLLIFPLPGPYPLSGTLPQPPVAACNQEPAYSPPFLFSTHP